MLKRIAIGLLVGIFVALAVGTLYYWRASQPYRAKARQLAAEAEQDLEAMAKIKDFDAAAYRGMREKIILRDRQGEQVEAMRQQARRNARIAAGASGIVAFIGWMFVGGRVMPARQQQTAG